jgi:hypothetical protein
MARLEVGGAGPEHTACPAVHAAPSTGRLHRTEPGEGYAACGQRSLLWSNEELALASKAGPAS